MRRYPQGVYPEATSDKPDGGRGLAQHRTTVELASMHEYRRDGISIEVSKRLLSYLLSGAVEPGDRLPSERQLAEVLGVGRSVVRESLKALTLLGLIDVRQGDGTYLRRPASDLVARSIEWGLLLGDQQIEQLAEARYHLEIVLVELATRRRDQADIAELARLLDAMDAAEPQSADRFIESDIAFHLAIARAAGNEPLAGVMSSIASLLDAWMHQVAATSPSHNPASEHQAIYEAIKAGDVERARAAMRMHIAAAYGRLGPTPFGERAPEPGLAPTAKHRRPPEALTG